MLPAGASPAPLPFGPEATGAPLPLQVTLPERGRQRRWTVLIRWILCLPLAVVVLFIGIATEVLVVIGWFGALAMGRTPTFVRTVTTVYLRLTLRLYAYNYLLTDRFPAFSLDPVPGEPATLAVPPATRMNRGAVFFRGLLVLPALVLVTLVTVGLQTFIVVVWLIVLVSGRLPAAVHDAYRATIRFELRVTAYFFLLVPTYPRELFGDEEPWTEGEAGPGDVGIGDVGPRDAGAGDVGPRDAGPGDTTELPIIESPAPWVLEMGRAAKGVLVVAIVLGCLYPVGFGALRVAQDRASLNQRNRLTEATNALVTQYNSYTSRSGVCEKAADPYRCAEAADRHMAVLLTTYAATLERTGNPGIDQSVLSGTASQAERTARALETIGRAGSNGAAFDAAQNEADLSRHVDDLQKSLNAMADQLNRGD